MKTFLFILTLLTLTLDRVHTQDLSAMTYNLRYDNPRDSANNWHNRKAMLAQQVLFHSPDFIGTQEGLYHQVAYLDSQLMHHTYIGIGRRGGEEGEYSALFFDTRKWSIVDEGTFWLSETPDEMSTGWDAALPRICTWGRFKSNTISQEIYVFNTHFDHRGQKAREHSAKLIISKIGEIADNELPVIFMGDLNSLPESIPIATINNALHDTHDCINCIRFGEEGTGNGFKIRENGYQNRIDYIFSSDHLQTRKYAVFSDLIDGRFISDHFPVFADFHLKD